MPAVTVRDRLAQLYLIRGEVRGREQATVLLHPVFGLLRERAAIKPINPLPCNLPISISQLWLLQHFALAIGRTIAVQKDAARFVELRQLFGRGSQSSRIGAID